MKTASMFDGENYLEYSQFGKVFIASYDDVELAIKAHNDFSGFPNYWETEEGQQNLSIIKAYKKSNIFLFHSGNNTALIGA